MPADDAPDEDLIREVYARFGLAYYQSECLHRGLCILLALSELPSASGCTRPRVEELLAQAFSLTLGEAAGRLEGQLPNAIYDQLRLVIDRRNFLAHHFWFERAHCMFSGHDVSKLIEELNETAELFERMDTLVSELSEPKRRELGLTEEVIQSRKDEILAGESLGPLPDKQTIKDGVKMLKRRQRLIRVWEFQLDDAKRPLVFELHDGSFWQLCDVGLGWTSFREVEPGWTENAVLKPYLPTDIVPRPESAAPWDYEFTLAKGAVMWVKPGPGQSFKWGVRR